MSVAIIKALPHQAQFLHYTGKMGAIRGGVGSGKTSVCAIWMLDRMTKFPKGQHYVIGADYPQLKRGFLISFKALLDRAGIRYTYRSGDGSYSLDDYGAKLQCLSSELEERIRSVEYDTCLLEEPQTWQGDAAELYKTIIGRLRGSPPGVEAYGNAIQPQLRMSFNPPAKSHWLHDVIEKQWSKEGYPCWRYSVRNNYLLGERLHEYVQLLESTYPRERWRSEIDGHWKDVGGSVYSSFSRTVHGGPAPAGLPPVAWDVSGNKAIWLACDFNVEWMSWCMGQVHVQPMVTKGFNPTSIHSRALERYVGPLVDGWNRRVHYVLGEVFLQNSNTERNIAAFIKHYIDLCGKPGAPETRYGKVAVWLYGDPSGGDRSQTIGSSNWQIIGRELTRAGIPFVWRVMGFHPRILDSVNAVNLQMRTESVIGSLNGVLIDTQAATNVVQDWEGVQWSKTVENSIDKSDKSPEGMKRTHLSDAYRYFAFVDRAEADGTRLDFPDWMNR